MKRRNIANNTALDAAPQGRGVTRFPPWVIAWFVSLMAATIVVRLADPTGWLGSDDSGYHSAAEHVLAGKTMERVHHQYARMAVVVPVATSMWLFGESPEAVALPTVVVSILCVALVVVAGRLLWGWAEGLAAASVVSFLPYFRVTSTTAYPDVHVCFWATVVIVLALLAIRGRGRQRVGLLGLGCGFALGIACSAKVFAVLAFLPIAWVAWLPPDWGRRERLRWLLAVAGGAVALFMVDGLFYLRVGGDFFFKLHALQNARVYDRYFPATGYFQDSTYLGLAWTRLTMLLRPGVSGWGQVATLFVPAVLLTLIFSRRGRPIAAWAALTTLTVALVPLTYRHHWHPFTPFDGRHILVTCVPFALCFAWVACQALLRVVRPAWIQRGWPLALAALVWMSYIDAGALRGFRDRETRRCSLALEQIIASEDWEEGREIFMPASIYLRYRMLFPKELSASLRVAVDENAPGWWRSASVDIASRSKPMPKPAEAYLIVTPLQLDGQFEFWDYGVGLPRRELAAWRQTVPRIRISRYGDKTVAPRGSRTEEGTDILILLGATATDSRASHPGQEVVGAG